MDLGALVSVAGKSFIYGALGPFRDMHIPVKNLASHGRGRWFEPSIAHHRIQAIRPQEAYENHGLF